MKLPRTTTCTSRCKSNDMCLCMFLWNVRSRCQSCCKNHPKTGGFFLFGRFFVRKKNHPKSLNSVDFHYWDFFCFDWLIDWFAEKIFTSFKNVVSSEVETERKTKKLRWMSLKPWRRWLMCQWWNRWKSHRPPQFTGGPMWCFFFFFGSLELLFFGCLGGIQKRQHFKHMNICSVSQQTFWNLRRFLIIMILSAYWIVD